MLSLNRPLITNCLTTNRRAIELQFLHLKMYFFSGCCLNGVCYILYRRGICEEGERRKRKVSQGEEKQANAPSLD